MTDSEISSRAEGGKRRCSTRTFALETKPLVSIVTAVYNNASTIEEAIKSVISQDYPSFEYIIIDGGSTDGTLDLIRLYDDYIDYWVSEPDKGIYDAFNKAIDLARGEWLYFLGADDKLFDEKVLSRFFSECRDSKMLYGNAIWTNTGKVYDGEFNKVKLYSRNICQQAIFYNRELFQSLGKFDLRYPLFSDWAFNIKVFGLKGANPVFLNQTVAFYSRDGCSAIAEDRAFETDKNTILKHAFGCRYYLYLKFLLGMRYFGHLLYLSFTTLVTDGPTVLFRKAIGLINRKLGRTYIN